MFKYDILKAKNFYNAKIFREIYKELNGVWKSRVTNHKRSAMSMNCLVERLVDQTS